MNEFTTQESSELMELIEKLVEVWKATIDNTTPYPPVAEGDLRNIEADYTLAGERFSIIFYLPEYWMWIENGRPPGKQPPPNVIERWIEVKHLVPNSSTHKIPNTKQLAYLIGRKIGKEGYEGRHLLQRTREAPETDTIIQQIKEVLISKIKRELNEVLVG